MSENNPYLKDKQFCNVCRKEAQFFCPYCKSLKIKRTGLCNKCAISKPNKSENLKYCTKCKQKLHKIPLRFVGSIGPVKKFDGFDMKKHPEAPKIYPKSDRDRIQRGATT